MSKTFFKLGLGLLAAVGMMWPAGVQAANVTLHGHVPAAVSHLASQGRLSGSTNLHLAIGLPLHNQAELDTLLAQMYDPASTNYHKYLSPAEFTEKFGPTAADYQAVVDFARANGLTVSETHPNRVVLDVSGKVSDIEKAFKVQMHSFKHPKEARSFFAPTTEPVISDTLPILHVSGLDNYYIPRSKMVRGSLNTSAGATPNAGTGPGGTYIGSDFRKVYASNTTLTGAGQNVGLLQFDGFFSGDVAAYATQAGLANPPQVITVPIDGGVSFPSGGNVEVAMDIEMIMAMAPGVSNIYVYEAPNPSPWVDLLSRMANDNLAKQLSCSWGGGPPDATAEQIFQQMALQGQTFYNASGDTDAFVPGVNDVTFPSDSPHIVQVGGVVLTTSAGPTFTSETAWNDRFPRPPGYQGTSGGISTFYTIPTWQQGISMVTNHGSTTMRNIPDVALTSLNVFIVADNGIPQSNGGTSAAAPLWAGFTALINQQAAINGKPYVGFINPALYGLAKTANYTNYFNDTTTGDNSWPGSPANFFAVPGYDLCDGLGSPKGTNLINALVGNAAPTNSGPIISAPRGPWGTTLGTLNGSNPNGAWFLFVQDDSLNNTGMISSGWTVTLTSANPVGYASDSQLYAVPAVATLNPGAYWNVTVAVTNYGPSFATNVLVTDSLPVGPGIVLSTAVPNAGTVTQFGSSLLWNVGNLDTNTGSVLNLSFHTTSAGVYSNGVAVSSMTLDPNPDDDTAGAVANVVVTTPPVLSGGAVLAGGKFKFHVDESAGSTSVIVQDSTNLLNWVSIYTNTTPFDYTNSTAGAPYMFYRVVTGP